MANYTHIGGALETLVKDTVRDVPDFPKPGIVFKDIAPVLAQPAVFDQVVQCFTQRYSSEKIDAIVAVESRGFIFGAPLAQELGVPFHMARKKGKLPFNTIEQSYDLEYGSAAIALHVDAVTPNERVVIIDDLLATGGTAAATSQLVQRLGATVVECMFLIELGFLEGRHKLADYDVCAVAKY